MRRRTHAFALALLLAAFGCGSSPEAPEAPPAARVTALDLATEDHPDRMLDGLYPSEGDWRWTKQEFSVSLDRPDSDADIYLELDFALVEDLMAELAPIALSARAGGVDLPSQSYDAAGRHVFLAKLSAEALVADRVKIDFSLDKARAATTEAGGRELGLIAVGVGLKEYEQTQAHRDQVSREARESYAKILERRDLSMDVETQRKLMKQFHELEIWRGLWFQGVEIIKNPLDLFMMQQIIYEVRPDFIVETGTMRGGSALYWAHTLHGFGLKDSRVITVDIEDQTQDVDSHPLWREYVTFMLGSSTAPEIVDRIAKMTEGKDVLVVLDSDHSAPHVYNELKAYSPMVSPGSYVVVEDTHFDSIPTFPDAGPGPTAAIEQFLNEGASDAFERDLTREAFVMTFNPGGWLRRKSD